MAVRFQLRRDTAANWASANSVLALGEPGVETDTLKVKVGDGSTAWNSLAYSITKDFTDLTSTPTTLAGYGITDALSLAGLSVTQNAASGTGAVTYNNATGVFSYTPPNFEGLNGNFTGSVFADDSTIMVDGVAGKIVGQLEVSDPFISGTIDSTDSSPITITPDVILSAGLTVGNHIIPSSNENIDLGSNTNRFRELFLSGNTISLDGIKLSSTGTALRVHDGNNTKRNIESHNIDANDVTVNNITTAGYLRGPASFVIDPAAFGDDTGTVVIAGNLQVDGTQTTINSTTVAIDDLNFSIATDAADSAAANGAGITVGGAGATLNYTHATTSWDMNKPLNVTGNIGVTGTVDGVDIQTLNTTAGAALPKAGGTMTGTLNVTQASTADTIKLTRGTTAHNNMIKFVTGSTDKWIVGQRNDNTDHFRFYSYGTSSDVLSIQTDGNVGIGTASPEVKLEVNGGADGSVVFGGRSDGGNGNNRRFNLIAYADGGGANYGGGLKIQTRDSVNVFQDRITVQSNGYVGIGTPSPAGKLHIQSGDAGVVTPSSQADDLVVEASTEGGITIMTPDDQSARIRFTSPSTESGDVGGADIFYRQNINKMSMGTTVSGGKLAFKSGAGVETIVLDDGNVGIGTAPHADWRSEATALQISPLGAIWNTSNFEDFNIGNNVYTDGTEKYIQNDAACKIRLTDAGIMDFRVTTAGSADAAITWNTALAINNNGQVGIGTDYTGSGLLRVGRAPSAADGGQRTIYADGTHDAITTNSTNYLHNVWIENHNFDIDSGVTDSGYRIGLNIEGYHDNSNLAGTLASQKNIWSRNGNNSGGTGTITNSYNMHLETLDGGGITITNNYGLYQSGTGTKNYFEGAVGIGTGDPKSKLDIQGAIAISNGDQDLGTHTYSTYASLVPSGCIKFTAGYSGSMAAGRTFVFQYNAVSWKAYHGTITLASTQGFSKHQFGGYWNNSGGHDVDSFDGASATCAVSHSGQAVIVTLTLTAGCTHPMVSVEYHQSGGDGAPRLDRAEMQIN